MGGWPENRDYVAPSESENVPQIACEVLTDHPTGTIMGKAG
jgi:hypothetical protein